MINNLFDKLDYSMGKAIEFFLVIVGYLISIVGIGTMIAASIAHFIYHAC